MWRSIAAVLVGYLVTAVLVIVGTVAASAALLPGAGRDPTVVVPTLYLAVNLGLSLLAAAAGGYVCGWIAPARPFLHAAILAGLFEILSLSMALSSGAAPGQPRWYPWVIGLLGMAGVLAGGAIRLAVAK